MSRAVSPLLVSPRSIMRSMASGTDAAVLRGADDRGARGVAEDERGAAVHLVDDRGELLRPDDEDVLRAPGPDHVGGRRDPVTEPGARGAQVPPRRVRAAQPVRD